MKKYNEKHFSADPVCGRASIFLDSYQVKIEGVYDNPEAIVDLDFDTIVIQKGKEEELLLKLTEVIKGYLL